VRTLVTANTATGSPTVSVVPFAAKGGGPRIHVIGGAGSAVNVTRDLVRLGFTLTGGIAHAYDSDGKLWTGLGIGCVIVDAFSWIGDADIERAAALVEAADLTVLCSFPVGPGNLGNLNLARRAKRLVILETGVEDMPRTFFTPEGEELFVALAASAERKTHSGLLAELTRGAVMPETGLEPVQPLRAGGF
jgi:iron complex transport system ATP-binding protein